MKILIVEHSIIPVQLYGGTQRVIWSLGKELSKLGHLVTFLVKQGSTCEFADVIFLDDQKNILDQIPEDIDVVHFNFAPENINKMNKPYIITMHGNANDKLTFDKNTVFVSENHASRYNSMSFVHNGLDWSDYSKPDLYKKRETFHFLGKTSWGVKNLTGAIQVLRKTKNERLTVLGGKRFSERVIKACPSSLFSNRIRFKGMVGGVEKERCLNASKGLIFPVLWHEPFGLAIIESLFYGCPIFGTPYGSLKELINKDVGYLSTKKSELAASLKYADDFDKKACHEYALENFNSKKMTLEYLDKYYEVLNGNPLNLIKPQLIEIQKEKYLAFD